MDEHYMVHKPITPQQEKFARAMACGVSQSDAYRKAYKAGKMTAKQVHEEACKLAAHPKVAPRIKELTAVSADVAVLEGAEILEEIARVVFSDIACNPLSLEALKYQSTNISVRVQCRDCDNLSAGFKCLSSGSGQTFPVLGDWRECSCFSPI
jgi:hypothetical protein